MFALQERQVKPIYDALETGSLKVALQTCNKLLKKQPQSELVKSLKALTLARAGKAEESSSICDEVLARTPTEDIVLAALSHSLRALGRHEDVTAMYDEAFKKQPGNEELGAQTFMANAKIGNWKVAQQVSTKMHKAFKDDRFLYWSIMSAVLQANDPRTPAATRAMLFGLSLRLIETAATPSITTPDRFYLHLSILFEMGRLSEAQKLLSSPAGQRLCQTSLVIDEVRAQVAVKRGLWNIEGELAKRRLEGRTQPQPQPEREEGPEQAQKDRNWLTYLTLLDATFCKQSDFALHATVAELNRVRDPKEIIREKQLEDEDKAERERVKTKLEGKGDKEDEEVEVVETRLEGRVRGTREVLENLADIDGHEERGSLLALLELERRIRDESELKSEDGVYVRLLARYFQAFGSKPSCYEDLRPYVTSLEGSDSVQWRAILDAVPMDTSTEHNLRRLSNVYKLRRVTLRPEEVTIESETETVQELMQRYRDALPLGKGLPKTDLQPADDLAVLAGEVFVSLWSLSGDSIHLSNAVIFLEHALTRSKHSYQFRLILIRIYRLLAAPGLALEHYRTLNPKQMQTDTLSHLILSRAATFSLAAIGDLTLPNECLEASQIYASNSTETAEMIARAFQHEKYSQVQDFILFEDRLDNSLQRDLTKMDHVRMRLTHEPAVPETIDVELLEFRFIFDRIHHDNRDFSILPDHQPKGQSFDLQTVLGGVHPAFGWLEVWLKIYVRALSQASDYDENAQDKTVDPLYLKLVPQLDDKRPLEERLAEVSSAELDELTPDEKIFWQYTTALAQWLEPHHRSSRPPKAVPRSTFPSSQTRSSNGSTGHPKASGNGTAAVSEISPTWQDPPELVSRYFEDTVARLDEVSDSKRSPWEPLHIAQLAQEAFVLFSIQTARFKAGARRKGDPLPQALKNLRANALMSLKKISDCLQKIGERESGVEKRKNLVAIAEKALPQVDHDFAFECAKKTVDARKRIYDGMAKGLIKISTTHSN